MQISDFPRPPDDNGRGIHWSARIYHPSGADLDFWISELTAMNMKWIKLLDDGDGSSLELCRRLIDAGMMPVVRLFRERPNPEHISGREISGVRKLAAAGVRYFETNNEPDLPAEWEGDQPENWLDIVTDNFIHDADIVHSEGGLLAVPAMGPGGKENVVEGVVARGRRDLFDKGAWLAIHNYTLNHPINYPDDPVNQTGQPLTREEFERYPAWSWDMRPMELINERRARDKNPGHTIDDDANCFRGWERAGKMVFAALGHYIPVISTEGGPVVGWGDDLRYNKIVPQQQAEMQVEIIRFLQERAPEWYFSCCTWLLASRPLGDFNPTWEQMSWYTDAWNERFGLAGRLPIVQALKDLPSVVRPELRRGTATLSAQVVRGDNGQPLANIPLTLESTTGGGTFKRRIPATTDSDGRFSLDRVSADSYRLLLFDTVLAQVTLTDNQRKHLELRAQIGQRSTLRGKVTDPDGRVQPGLPVSLHQTNPARLIAQTTVDASGLYSFSPLTAGVYSLRVAPGSEQASERRNIDIDGWENEEQNITVPQAARLRYQILSKKLLSPQETGNENKISGQVLDASGNPLDGKSVRLRWTGADPSTEFPTVKSGQNPFKPRGYFEFVHTPGVFSVEVVDPESESEVADNLITADMPQRSRPITYDVTFQLTTAARPVAERSVIAGLVSGGPLNGAVTLSGGGGEPQARRLDQQRSFRFDGLSAGIYQVSLEGVGVIAEELILNGTDEANVEFPMRGQISGRVLPAKTGEKVMLTCQEYSIRKVAITGADGVYRLAGLPADEYTLTLQDSDLPSQKISLDGRRLTEGPVFERQTASVPPPPPVVPSPTVDSTPPARTKSLCHYMLLDNSDPATTAQRLLLAQDYILRSKVTVGYDGDAVTEAERVTIVGSVASQVIEALAAARTPVQRVSGDLEKIRQELEALQ